MKTTTLTATDDMITPEAPSNDGVTFCEISLSTLHHDGREIAYSTSSNSKNLPPVLFFYPGTVSPRVLCAYWQYVKVDPLIQQLTRPYKNILIPVGGGNRRMLYSFRNLFSDLFFICVNRPGTGGTSPAKQSGAAAQLQTAVRDAAVVLDMLRISKVSLMCMCAGTPFCLSFAATYPERTTGKMRAISSWIQPADAGYENTKTTFYLGTTMTPLVAPIAGLVFASIGSSLTSFPTSMTVSALRSGLSTEEREAFDALHHDKKAFATMMKWIQAENGNNRRDVSVLLSANLVDYEAVNKSQDNIILWHGANDKLVPLASCEWLADEQLTKAAFHTIEGGTHEGLNFLLHVKIVDSIKALGQP